MTFGGWIHRYDAVLPRPSWGSSNGSPGERPAAKSILSGSLDVFDTEHLDQLMRKFEQVEGVQRVERKFES